MKKTIGIVVAMDRETGVKEKFAYKTEYLAGIAFNIFQAGENKVVLAESGIGEVRAAAATALLIGRYNVDEIINYGYVGSLNESIPVNAVCAVDEIFHTDVDLVAFGNVLGQYDGRDEVPFKTNLALTKRIADLPLKKIASSDKFIASGEKKKELRKVFGADICDMESAGVAEVCDRANVPFAILKIVSDGVESDCTDSFWENSIFGIVPLVDLICDYLVK